MSDVKQSKTVRSVGWTASVFTGSIAVTVCLLMFVSYLWRISEVAINGLIVSFVLCGAAAAAIGRILLRRAFPVQEFQYLFEGPCRVITQASKRTDTPAAASHAPSVGAKPAHLTRSGAHPSPVMVSHGSESVARFTTHESAGALVLMCVILMSYGLVMRFNNGWAFLPLAVVAGAAMALVLYLAHGREQTRGIFSYTVPVAGGVVGSAAMIGVGLVMSRFAFLRVFLGLSVGAGGAVALVLAWIRRKQHSGSLFV
jgi:hypothetical protein